MSKNIFKVAKWMVTAIIVAYVALVIYRIPHAIEQKKTDQAVAKIHATKLTLDDVMGKNLPPDPGALADQTIAGVDANQNGIRDDVELAVFKAYPNSARTRAVLLQYALALQMEMTQDMVNTETVTAVAEDGDTALNCLWSISSRSNMKKFLNETSQNEKFVKSRQINTTARDRFEKDFYTKLGSYMSPNAGCYVNLSTLPN
ncbi:MAG: hypothetical protein HY226_03890 [Candidatus Vogelbacteria bacterium]|nr:hypothetical protein [Candidatus Vogelbacteria bacterium]